MEILFNAYKEYRTKPVNLREGDAYIFSHEYEVLLPASHVLSLQHACILRDTVFSFRNARFYWPYTHFIEPGIKSKLSRFKLFRHKPLRIPRACWISNQWSAGYFHWLTDALPRLLALRDRIGDMPVLLPERYANLGFVRESLTMLGVNAFYFDPLRAYLVEELLLPSHIAPTGNYNAEIIRQLRSMLTPGLKPLPSRRVYISRKKARFRKILNEEALEKLLELFNFEIHCFEDYSFVQQIEIMNATQTLIGLHGAGLTNMMFMQQGTRVFELRNAFDISNNCYFSLASALDIAYYYQVNEGDSRETLKAGITIDLTRLRTNLELMFA